MTKTISRTIVIFWFDWERDRTGQMIKAKWKPVVETIEFCETKNIFISLLLKI